MILKITPGHHIPHKPNVATIHLHYDGYAGATFDRGEQFVLWFTIAGELYSVEKPVP